MIVLNGMLSQQSSGEFQRKLKKLAREFDDLNNDDAALPLGQRNGATVVMAVRNWRYGLFEPLLRDKLTLSIIAYISAEPFTFKKSNLE